MRIPSWSRLVLSCVLSVWLAGVAIHFAVGLDEVSAGAIAGLGLPFVLLGQYAVYRWYRTTSIYDRSRLRGRLVQAVGPALAALWSIAASLWLTGR